MFLIMLAGAIVLGVGLLVSYPVIWLAIAFIYRDLLSQTENVPIAIAG
jgi:uncharacterized membrane protein